MDDEEAGGGADWMKTRKLCVNGEEGGAPKEKPVPPAPPLFMPEFTGGRQDGYPGGMDDDGG